MIQFRQEKILNSYSFNQNIKVDLVVEDKNNQPIILVEVKAGAVSSTKKEAGKQQLMYYLSALNDPIPFAIFADLETIMIFQCQENRELKLLGALNTAEILEIYEPQFKNKQIFADYFITLLSSWLDDLAFHWKLEKPPAYEIIKSIGLLEKIEGGSTQELY